MVFAGQVDAGFLPQAELRQIRPRFLDAQFKTQAVEEGIRRHLNGFHQIGRAVAAAHRIAKLVLGAGNAPRARCGNNRMLVDFAAFKQRHAHKRLKGRTRRIQTLGYAVDHRPLPVFVKRFPGIAVDAVDKQIGIKAGLGNKGDDAAGLRVDGHQRAAAAGHQAVGFLLDTDVHRQTQGLAGLRRVGFDFADNVAGGVFLHFAVAGHAVQLGFVKGFQTGFADVGGAVVGGGTAGFFKFFLVFVADAADVAEKVRSQAAVGVFAEGAGVDFHAGEAVKLGRQPRGFVGREFQFQRHFFIGAHIGAEFFEALDVGFVDFDISAQIFNQIFDFAVGFFGDHFQRIGRIIARQHHTVGVDDFAAHRRSRNQADAVGGGLNGVFVVFADLQVEKAGAQHAEHYQYQQQRRQQADQKISLPVAGFPPGGG